MLMSAVIGHRGARGSAPENTLRAINRAAELGVSWIELDVMLTRDQVPILFHDALLNKLSNGRGEVAKLDFNSLGRIRVLAPHGSVSESHPLTTLDAALQRIQDLGLGLNLEIKPTSPEVGPATLQFALKELAAFPGLPLVISSFNYSVLLEAKRLLPEVPRACLWEDLPRRWQRQAAEVGARSVHLSHQGLKARQVAEIRSEGREVYIYTVNSRRRAKQLFEWGVNGIFTDYPERFEGLKQPVLRTQPFGDPV
ncbi:glycerophosphodiester phosphodiesterase family protein [Marinospirillum perlucidum]|uniref:glycerophosphodiester phosphodiesterase family protein n=1 Tax=Marinospirillum perlucidum TaxID=1982602 RepID=UPI000DF25329|nr:glycerophosphodiester phosphodiesterase family protein [Marinospirillum perlucidum]